MKPFVQVSLNYQKFSSQASNALENVHLEFFPGQMIGITGPDGSGKTTLLRLIASVITPTSGKILVNGHDTVLEQNDVVSFIGYMPQKFGLYEDLTVMENLLLFASLRTLDLSKASTLLDNLLEFTSLKPFTKRLAGNLSGGMKQKLGLACALLKKPKVLILDEPSVGVDPLSRKELWAKVVSLLDNDICILWSTTYLDEAEKCDQVVLLNEGKVCFYGKPQQLLSKVENRVVLLKNVPDIREKIHVLIEDPQVLDGVIEGSSLRLVLKENGTFKDGEKTQPRLEDAFVDLIKKQSSSIPLFSFTKKTQSQEEFPIQAKNLTKYFGQFLAADQISFQVKKGQIFGLLGPNGAGKSTTFKMLAGLLAPTSGQSLIDGKSSLNVRHDIGYMAQKFSLYGNITLLQNLKFFASIYCKSNNEKDMALKNVVSILGLTPYLSCIADTLPIGIKQRLSFAASIMHSPKVLFLDEPTSGMDPITRRSFWRQISFLARQGCTILVSTHFMDEAENCDKIAILLEGKMIYLGDCDELKSKYANQSESFTFEQAFIALMQQRQKCTKD